MFDPVLVTTRRVLLALLLSALPGCGFFQQPCGCGESFENDPWTGEVNVVGATHDIGVHCVCRCGDDPEVLEAPSRACEQYEGDCRTASGVAASYVCE